MLVINTDESLYKPVQVTIDGQVYTVAKITRGVQLQLMALDEQWRAGDLDAGFRRIELLLGKQPWLEKLDVRELQKLTDYIVRKYYAPNAEDRAEEKKAPEAGEKA